MKRSPRGKEISGWLAFFLLLPISLSADNGLSAPARKPSAALSQASVPRILDDGGPEFLIPPPLGQGNTDPQGDGRARILAGTYWGKDIYASRLSWPRNFDMNDISLSVHPSGRLYIAYEALSGSDRYIEVNNSEDGGLTWKSSGWVQQAGKDLTNPSLVVTDQNIVVAYVVDNGINNPYVETANAPLNASLTAFTPRSIVHVSPAWERHPQLWTDYHVYYGNPYVYLACEWVYDAGANNVDAVFQRSMDDGDTWSNRSVVFGNEDADEYTEPGGCFGSATTHYLFVTCFNRTSNTVVLRRSADWGVGWDSKRSVSSVLYLPATGSVDPSIAAATMGMNPRLVVIYTTGTLYFHDDINYVLSEDNGTSFEGPYVLPGRSADYDDYAGRLSADARGRSFHVVFTQGSHIVYHTKLPQTFATGFSTPQKVNRGGSADLEHPLKGLAIHWDFDFPNVAWADSAYNPGGYCAPFFNRLCPDDLIGTWTGQGVYFRTETNRWKKMSSPATLVAAGDVDGDGTADLFGDYVSPAGLWVERSTTKTWLFLGSAASDLFGGDMDGDSTAEVVGTWDSQGVFYLSQVGGVWKKLATPASIIAAGNVDGDSIDDLLGVWPGQGGVWVKYSLTGKWEKLGSTPRHLTAGDMNGDGRADLLGTWDGQGVFYLDSVSKTWVKMATPATLLAAGDLDGDGKDDLIGIWPGQDGVWVKYSSTDVWAKLSSTAADIAAGVMRGGAGSWYAQGSKFEPVGPALRPGYGNDTNDSAQGPGSPGFECRIQPNLVPQESGEQGIIGIPGPGEAGFQYLEQKNLVPEQNRARTLVPRKVSPRAKKQTG